MPTDAFLSIHLKTIALGIAALFGSEILAQLTEWTAI